MRAWGTWATAVLVVIAGCGAQPGARQLAEPPARGPLAAHRPPPVDPGVLARRLEAMQPDRPARDERCVRCVALTFDDGPGEDTGKLLDMLREHGARATFFVVGQMAAAPGGAALLRRIAREGHEIGNHSWTHAQLTALSQHGIAQELQRTGDLVRFATGVRMHLMRPPYGSTDSRVAAESRRRGLAQILWNIDTYDWRDRVPSIVAKRASRAKPGSVVLMHDIHRTTVKAVPRVLEALTRKGYRLVTVSELYGKRPKPGKRYSDAAVER